MLVTAPTSNMTLPDRLRHHARPQKSLLRRAPRALEVHDLGHDPSGFFTERKEVFSIWSKDKRVGFTTLTWKYSDCAKTGPTIIEPQYKRKGFGRAARREIEILARNAGMRKIYCTSADNAHEVINYLLDSGMKIEAHLDRQYSGKHGELVFGKFLMADEFAGERKVKRTMSQAKLIDIHRWDRNKLREQFAKLFTQNWVAVDDAFAEQLLKSALAKGRPDPRAKSKRLVCLAGSSRIVGATVLLPKRGGAVKAMLSASTENPEALHLMIEEACRLSCSWGSRKIYFLHPLLDATIVKALKKAEFQMEGFLKAPYRPGEDVGIFSRFC